MINSISNFLKERESTALVHCFPFGIKYVYVVLTDITIKRAKGMATKAHVLNRHKQVIN